MVIFWLRYLRGLSNFFGSCLKYFLWYPTDGLRCTEPETEETPAPELPLVDEIFEAVRSRGACVHVVPTLPLLVSPLHHEDCCDLSVGP